MSVNTRSQKLAQRAYICLEERKKRQDFDEYATVACKFPALIHTCGLAQAAAFAQSKRKADKPTGGAVYEYLNDLAAVLMAGGHLEIANAESLATHTRADSVTTYIRLSRDAIEGAVWLKRYAEAFSDESTPMSETKI